MKRKNAFTLMELLAVLVVLAIIALIIFPIIGDVIKDSKMKAFKSSVQGLADSAELDYQKDDYEGDRTYQYENGNLTLLKVGTTSKNENIKVEGLIENGVGRVYIDPDGEISLTVHNEDWCATKEITENTITIEEKTDDNCNLPKTFTEIMTNNPDVASLDPDNNLRYVGQTPNNYVSFNGELWRIIGVFDGQAKIIKDDYYNTAIMWDDNSDGSETNNWATASLQLALNNTTDGYIKTIQTNDPTSYGYIDLEHVWNIGAYDASHATTGTRNAFYSAERSETPAGASGSESTWTGTIGLMYPSDYGYASSGSSETCNNTVMYDWLESTDATAYTECAVNSWLYDSEYNQWALTPQSGISFGAFCVSSAGLVLSINLDGNRAAHPVLYLKSDTKIVGGLGTEQEPFELGI